MYFIISLKIRQHYSKINFRLLISKEVSFNYTALKYFKITCWYVLITHYLIAFEHTATTLCKTNFYLIEKYVMNVAPDF